MSLGSHHCFSEDISTAGNSSSSCHLSRTYGRGIQHPVSGGVIWCLRVPPMLMSISDFRDNGKPVTHSGSLICRNCDLLIKTPIRFEEFLNLDMPLLMTLPRRGRMALKAERAAPAVGMPTAVTHYSTPHNAKQGSNMYASQIVSVSPPFQTGHP